MIQCLRDRVSAMSSQPSGPYLDRFQLAETTALKWGKEYSVPSGALEAAILKYFGWYPRDFIYGGGGRWELGILKSELGAACRNSSRSVRELLDGITYDTSKIIERIGQVRWINYRGFPLYSRARLRRLLTSAPMPVIEGVALRRGSYWPSEGFKDSFPTEPASSGEWLALCDQLGAIRVPKDRHVSCAVAVLNKVLGHTSPEVIERKLREAADRYSAARPNPGTASELLGFGPFAMLVLAVGACFELEKSAWERAAKRVEKHHLFYEKPRFGVRLRANNLYDLSQSEEETLFRDLKKLQKDLKRLLQVDIRAVAEELGWNGFQKFGVSGYVVDGAFGPVDLSSRETFASFFSPFPPAWWALSGRPTPVARWERAFVDDKEKYWLWFPGEQVPYGPFPVKAKAFISSVLLLPPGSTIEPSSHADGESTNYYAIVRNCRPSADALVERLPGPKNKATYRLRVKRLPPPPEKSGNNSQGRSKALALEGDEAD
jgi:hypothetical protein